MAETNLDDRFGGLVPDTLLPDQFFGALRRRAQLDGERRLMMAVLEDAVNVFMKQVFATDPKARQLFVEAEEWITEDDRSWFFSFTNVCDTLDLDADYIRSGLLRWKDRVVADARTRAEEAASQATAEDPDAGLEPETETVLLKASGG